MERVKYNPNFSYNQRDNTDFSRTGPAAGCIAAIVFTTCWIISAFLWDDWTLGADSLSSIGASREFPSAIIFNFGCLLTGILIIFPGLYLIEHENDMCRYSGYAALLCSVPCAGMGIITEDYGIYHTITASLYSLFAVAFIATSAAGDYKEGKKIYTMIAIIMLPFCLLLSFVEPFGTFEPVGASFILFWTFIQSALLLKMNSKN